MNAQDFCKMLDKVKKEEVARYETKKQEAAACKEKQKQELLDCIINKDNWSYDSDNDEFVLNFVKPRLDDILCSVLEEYLGKKVYSYCNKPKEGCNYVLLYAEYGDQRVFVSFIE